MILAGPALASSAAGASGGGAEKEGAMAYEGYRCLRIRCDQGLAFVTIDHPPINLFDVALNR